MPIAGLFGSLLGGLGGGQSGTAAAAGPTNQTVNTGAISLGSKYLGRGSVTASDTNASGGSTLTAPAADHTGLYVAGGVAALVALALLFRR